MKVHIDIRFDTGNAWFEEVGTGIATVQIMAGVTQKLMDGESEGVIFDENGNSIGAWDAYTVENP